MSGTKSIPQYAFNAEYSEQEVYQELLNRILSEWFRTDTGFFLPSLTNAEVATLVAITPAIPAPRIWFNSDLGKAQLLVSPGTTEVITSV